MKMYKKIAAGLLAAAMVFSFFSCDNAAEEDEDLTVVFTPKDGATITTSSKIRLVAADSNSNSSLDAISTVIYYTTDGTDPLPSASNITWDANGVPTITGGSTAKKYTEIFTISATGNNEVTVKARSVKLTEKKYSPLYTATYTISDTSSDGEETPSTDVTALPNTFMFAKDTDLSSFVYYSSARNDGADNSISKEGRFSYDNYDNCQYQIQFSASKKWALYTRVAYGQYIETIKSGTYTYTGSTNPCLGNNTGTIQLKLGDDTDWGSIEFKTVTASIQKTGDLKETKGFTLNVAAINTLIGAVDAK